MPGYAHLRAVAILVTVVLPAEYAIDPTGVGRVLGLTEMGETKRELAEEAEADRLLDEQRALEQSSSVLDAVFGLFVGSAHAQEAWRDEVTFTLEPGATAEIKMTMEAGNVVDWPPRRRTRSQACQPSSVCGRFRRVGQSGHGPSQAAQ
jgi:hypothetical protein